MNKPSTVSVVIPAYNYGHLLGRAMDSVLAQDPPPVELIIVDDGSTDDTAKVVAGYVAAAGAVPVRYLGKENAGPSAARNDGVDMACGDYIFLLDADDAMLPGALAALLVPVTGDPSVDLVIGGCHAVDAGGRSKPKAAPELSADPEDNFRGYLEKRLAMSHGRFIARRSLFERIRYPEHLWSGEDLSVFAHLLALGKAAAVPVAVSEIFHHDDSLRHDAVLSEEAGLKMVDTVFDPRVLPAALFNYRTAYYVARCLSLFRKLERAGECEKAEHYYRLAVGAFPPALFRLSYLRKYLRMKISAPFAGLFRRIR